MHQLWQSSFFWKSSKLNLNLENRKKTWEKLFFPDNCIWGCCYKLFLLRREYLLLAVNGIRNSPKILDITKRESFQLNFLHRDKKKIVKVLSFRFEQCFGPFTMLLVHVSSETGLFRDLSNHVFRST